MLYREAFLPPGPSAKEPYGPLVRKVEGLDKKLSDSESQTFDNFDDLPSEKGQEVESSKFSCFGTQWRVSICPVEPKNHQMEWYHHTCRGAQRAKN